MSAFLSPPYSSVSLSACPSLSLPARLSLSLEWDIADQSDPELCLCVCLSISLSDLLSVNVGLFDQYFRLIGQHVQKNPCTSFIQTLV